MQKFTSRTLLAALLLSAGCTTAVSAMAGEMTGAG